MNLNQDEINFFGAKTDSSMKGTPRVQSIKREKISFGRNISQNQNFEMVAREIEREREREIERERK